MFQGQQQLSPQLHHQPHQPHMHSFLPFPGFGFGPSPCGFYNPSPLVPHQEGDVTQPYFNQQYPLYPPPIHNDIYTTLSSIGERLGKIEDRLMLAQSQEVKDATRLLEVTGPVKAIVPMDASGPVDYQGSSSEFAEMRLRMAIL